MNLYNSAKSIMTVTMYNCILPLHLLRKHTYHKTISPYIATEIVVDHLMLLRSQMFTHLFNQHICQIYISAILIGFLKKPFVQIVWRKSNMSYSQFYYLGKTMKLLFSHELFIMLGKLRGMNEHLQVIKWPEGDSGSVSQRVLQAANLASIVTVEPGILR